MNLEDTQPSYVISRDNDIEPPPRWLFYGVLLLFGLSVFLPPTGIVVFKNLLRPSQQQRVINNLPFMASFLPYRGNVSKVL